MISASLLEILCCPETHQPLRIADAALLERLNQQITRGAAKNCTGQTITDPIAEGLVREDGKVVYAIRNGIPVLLPSEGILVADSL